MHVYFNNLFLYAILYHKHNGRISFPKYYLLVCYYWLRAQTFSWAKTLLALVMSMWDPGQYFREAMTSHLWVLSANCTCLVWDALCSGETRHCLLERRMSPLKSCKPFVYLNIFNKIQMRTKSLFRFKPTS